MSSINWPLFASLDYDTIANGDNQGRQITKK